MSFQAALLYGGSYTLGRGQSPRTLEATTIAAAKREAHAWLRSNRIMARASDSPNHPIPTAIDVTRSGKHIARCAAIRE